MLILLHCDQNLLLLCRERTLNGGILVFCEVLLGCVIIVPDGIHSSAPSVVKDTVAFERLGHRIHAAVITSRG